MSREVHGVEICAEDGQVGVRTHGSRWRWMRPASARRVAEVLLQAAAEAGPAKEEVKTG